MNVDDYAKLVQKRSLHVDTALQALDIVAAWIKKKQHILVGGQAIDFALRCHGEYLYEDWVIPDYDIICVDFHSEAYALADELAKHGLSNISVINALHPSTMKVRVNFIVVCDITYIPKVLWDLVPTIKCNGFNVVHPHYQCIDQHISLSRPYENAPYYTIRNRLGKDIKRHDLLIKYFGIPQAMCDIPNDLPEVVKITIPVTLLTGHCLGGAAALAYWAAEAAGMGYRPKNTDVFLLSGSLRFNIDNTNWHVHLSKGMDITVYSDDFPTLLQHSLLKDAELTYFNAIMDKIPRRIIVNKPDMPLEILDNRGTLITAKPMPNGIHVANLQTILSYFTTCLTYYSMKKNGIKAKLYASYCEVAENLVQWAAHNYVTNPATNIERSRYLPFLPTAKVYGQYNWSDRLMLQRAQADAQISKVKFESPLPRHYYLNEDLGDEAIAAKPREPLPYDPTEHEIMLFDGEPCGKFAPRNL